MKHLIASIALLVFCSAVSGNAQTPTQQKSITKIAAKSARAHTAMIGKIKDESLVDDCGCSYGFPSRRDQYIPGYVFIVSYDLKTAWMHIDGQDTKLTLANTSTLRSAKIGAKYSSTYVGIGIKVVIVFTVTRVCKPYGPDCESTGYSARVTAKKEGRIQVKRLNGACGCS